MGSFEVYLFWHGLRHFLQELLCVLYFLGGLRDIMASEIQCGMARHVAEVTLLESFDLGKNTAQKAGIEIKVFDKGPAGKRGPQLGTIRIGQGSFAWWPKSTKLETKTGKRQPPLKLGWSEFAAEMEKMISDRRG